MHVIAPRYRILLQCVVEPDLQKGSETYFLSGPKIKFDGSLVCGCCWIYWNGRSPNTGYVAWSESKPTIRHQKQIPVPAWPNIKKINTDPNTEYNAFLMQTYVYPEAI
jgi:hypothetical protein